MLKIYLANIDFIVVISLKMVDEGSSRLTSKKQEEAYVKSYLQEDRGTDRELVVCSDQSEIISHAGEAVACGERHKTGFRKIHAVSEIS